jgi:cell division septum initiation protein DivIVA
MKKETLEEVAERILFENTKNVEIRYRGDRDSVIKSMLDIAKWQQEQDKRLYSEEDMFKFLDFINNRYYGSFSIDKEDLQEWFEQFKNK